MGIQLRARVAFFLVKDISTSGLISLYLPL